MDTDPKWATGRLPKTCTLLDSMGIDVHKVLDSGMSSKGYKLTYRNGEEPPEGDFIEEWIIPGSWLTTERLMPWPAEDSYELVKAAMKEDLGNPDRVR